MQEQEILIEDLDPVALLGVNNAKLSLVKRHFPSLKVIARGNVVKVIGDKQGVQDFVDRFGLLMDHYRRFHRLTEGDIQNILSDGLQMPRDESVLVYGNKGLQIKPKTPGHFEMVKAARENDLVLVSGPAGTGKTYTAVALAVRALKDKQVRRIILTRPAVEAGENIGFLPGDMKEKLDPYMQPIYDALYDMLPPKRLADYLESRTIEIAPLGFMRGRTLDHAYVILDEAQNTTPNQMKMFLTRMGVSAKFIITGDLTQVDLPRKQRSGLPMAMQRLGGVEGIGIVRMDAKDVIRHPLVKRILRSMEENAEDE